ncbi:MAG TPA: hypothetical protein VHX38_29745 [Pseudonocardiaceae bacterium]|nr:hypothetical protein [Pseudonocardiaceae bacterium]
MGHAAGGLVSALIHTRLASGVGAVTVADTQWRWHPGQSNGNGKE